MLQLSYRFIAVGCEKRQHHGKIHNNALADTLRPPSGPLPTLPFPDFRLLLHHPPHGREPYHGLETSRKPPPRGRIHRTSYRCNLTSPTTISVLIVLFQHPRRLLRSLYPLCHGILRYREVSRADVGAEFDVGDCAENRDAG